MAQLTERSPVRAKNKENREDARMAVRDKGDGDTVPTINSHSGRPKNIGDRHALPFGLCPSQQQEEGAPRTFPYFAILLVS